MIGCCSHSLNTYRHFKASPAVFLFPANFIKNNELRLMFTLNCKGRLVVIDKPLVMGILNITPDSFYSGSRYQTTELVLHETEKMVKDGAFFLDIGGQSTRPGSDRIDVEEELKRVIPVIESIHRNFPQTRISIDTYDSK